MQTRGKEKLGRINDETMGRTRKQNFQGVVV